MTMMQIILSALGVLFFSTVFLLLAGQIVGIKRREAKRNRDLLKANRWIHKL